MKSYIIANVVGAILIGAICALSGISFMLTIILGLSYFALITYIKKYKEK